MGTNNLVKLIAVLLLVVLGFWFVSTLLFGTGMGYSMNITGNYGGEHMNSGMRYGYGYNYNYGNSLTYLLLSLVKILFVVFLVALGIGAIIWVKNNMFSKDDVDAIRSTFSGNKASIIKYNCKACGREMESDWKVCPHCGEEKEPKIEQQEDKQPKVKANNKEVEKKRKQNESTDMEKIGSDI